MSSDQTAYVMLGASESATAKRVAGLQATGDPGAYDRGLQLELLRQLNAIRKNVALIAFIIGIAFAASIVFGLIIGTNLSHLSTVSP